MKYSKENEKNKLLANYQGEKNFEVINLIVNFMVENIDALFRSSNIDTEITLKILAEGNETKIEGLLLKISILHNQDNVEKELKINIENLFKLLTGNVNDIVRNASLSPKDTNNLAEISKNIVKEYINDLILELQLEKSKDVGTLLYQASLEDAKAMQEGKRLKVEERTTYKILKKMQEKSNSLS